MQNEWLKDKVRAELEVEYIQKLDELRDFYEKKFEENNQEAWDIIQNYKDKYEKECKKNERLEVSLYQEYEKKIAEYKQFIRAEAVSKD